MTRCQKNLCACLHCTRNSRMPLLCNCTLPLSWTRIPCWELREILCEHARSVYNNKNAHQKQTVSGTCTMRFQDISITECECNQKNQHSSQLCSRCPQDEFSSCCINSQLPKISHRDYCPRKFQFLTARWSGYHSLQ